MTDDNHDPTDGMAFSEVLQSLGDREESKLSLSELVHAFGERGFGALMLFFGLLSVAIGIIPGTTTVLGAPLLLIGIQLVCRRDQLWLPKWALERAIDREAYRAGVATVMDRLKRVERLSRPRLSIMTNEVSEILIGIATTLLAFILVLPIWGGNLIPAPIICAFGFGLMQQDGLAVLIAWCAIALMCTAGLIIWLAWTWVSPFLLPVWHWLQALPGDVWAGITGLFGQLF